MTDEEKEGTYKVKPRTYDMTFCVSECKKKCDRHYSQYEFDKNRLVSIADFNCKNKEKEEKEIK